MFTLIVLGVIFAEICGGTYAALDGLLGTKA